ncbi:Protein-tyrosine phosphatase, low molecular weight [Hydrogenobacter thermophilus TK-6]|uniref:Protein tyrosine phosphatase/arsenate reductase n=1 Tax=Hydrogenobacter thermophilus (strain DSM 6534 / IAM 12695 / TK-6) TaxID=608538 RepID=D3DII1_HYDTT|nr:low molecular weight phosphatase family protein [Hydrogenobacter thermophilus]ADO45559.1 Protein-tyrosine phosphatase, low molecular weight [Hydrogenobacter thermophilus TK-6]BAI69633.1 protein tyrosine phosphatase/arsenate reductase [Hydrogenobacter thermophilus TK-6]
MRLCFISTAGAVRSVMAEAIAKKMSKDALLLMEIFSAGVEPLDAIPQQVIEVLKEKGYLVETAKPRSLQEIPYEDADIIITLSAEARDKSPYMYSHKRREHWVLEDVKDLSNLQALRKLRDQIEENISSLFKIR